MAHLNYLLDPKTGTFVVSNHIDQTKIGKSIDLSTFVPLTIAIPDQVLHQFYAALSLANSYKMSEFVTEQPAAVRKPTVVKGPEYKDPEPVRNTISKEEKEAMKEELQRRLEHDKTIKEGLKKVETALNTTKTIEGTVFDAVEKATNLDTRAELLREAVDTNEKRMAYLKAQVELGEVDMKVVKATNQEDKQESPIEKAKRLAEEKKAEEQK